MPSSNKTENFGLNLWSGTDMPKKDDFNADNLIVDGTLASKFGPSIAGATNWDSANLPIEQGTWSPTFIGGTVNGTGQVYAIQNGVYYKIGRFVHLSWYLDVTKSSTSTGAPLIGGVPFVCRSHRAAGSLAWVYGATGFTSGILFASMATGSSNIQIAHMNPTGMGTLTIEGNFSTRVILQGSIDYITD